MRRVLLLSLLLAGVGLRGEADAPAPKLTGPEVVKLDWAMRALRATDLDGDGRTDLLVVNNDRARIELLRQLAPGAARRDTRPSAALNRWEPVLEDARFEKDNFVVGITVYDLVVADLDGDKRPDLIYTGDPDALTVVRQKADGTWGEKVVVEIPAPAQAAGNLVVADLNGDGRPDIASLGQKELCVLLQQADRSFGPVVHYALTEGNLFGLEAADLNGDGRPDLQYVSLNSRESLRVRWQGSIPGQFGPEQSYRMEPARSSLTVLPAGSGKLPQLAYVEQRTGQLSVVQLRDRTPGPGEPRLGHPRVFSPRTGGRQGFIYAMADFDGDGLADIVASDPESAQIYLYLRQKDGGFAPEAAFPSMADTRALAAADWDGDKRVELFLASGKEQLAAVSSLEPSGRLTYPSPLPGKGRALAIAAGALATGETPQVLALREDAGKRWIDFISRKGEKAVITQTLGLPAQRGEPKALRLLDFNQDGRADIAVFTPFDTLRLFLQSADGSFAEASSAAGFRRGLVDNLDAGRVTTADVDGDGKDEIIVSSAGFARALRMNAAGELTIVEQFNAREATAEIGTALPLPPAQPKGSPEFLLYERKNGEFQVLQRDTRKVYAFASALPAGKIDPVAAQLNRSPSGRTEVFIFGADRFWWLPLDQTEPEARKVAGYTSDLRDTFYADVATGDLNGDGRPELICNDSQHHLIEVLVAGEKGAWRSALHFMVFDRDAHVRQKNDSQYEPREMLVADVTGDGRQDLILLVHDRLLIYPQAAPGEKKP